MELGSGIAIAAVCGTVITGILKFIPSKKGNGVEGKDLKRIEDNLGDLKKSIVFSNTCAATHKGVDDKLDTLNEGIKEIKQILIRREQ